MNEKASFAALGAPYTIDNADWTFLLFDYYQTDARLELEKFLWGGTFGFDPIPDGFTVNGFFTGDKWNITNVNRSETIRVRVINSAAFSTFTVSIDGLPLTLIELDGVAVEPLDLSKIKLYTAQRASFVVDWSRLNSSITDSCSIYLRFEMDPSIYPQYDKNAQNFNIFGSTTNEPVDFFWKGVVSFNDDKCAGSIQVPSYSESAVPVVNALNSINQNILEAIPVFKQIPPLATYNISIISQFYLVRDDGIVRAFINDGMFPSSSKYYPVKPTQPMLYSIMTADSPTLYSPTIIDGTIQGTGEVPFVLPYNEVIDIYIDGECCGAHPFHLHGHHFWIMATNEVPNACDIQGGNCLVRDVVTVPFGGWAVIRIISNNPGVWLFHCHLHWHFAMGLAAMFIEAPEVLYERYQDGTLVPPEDHIAMCSAETAVYRSELESPSLSPLAAPVSTMTPSAVPTVAVTAVPSILPTSVSTTSPTIMPSTISPSSVPTLLTIEPSVLPSEAPSTITPSTTPSAMPSTVTPTSSAPSSVSPTAFPTTKEPSEEPSCVPTTMMPTSKAPTQSPSVSPVTFPPLPLITLMPSEQPRTTILSSLRPSAYPSTVPTSYNPTHVPTALPSTSMPSTTAPSTIMPSTIAPSSSVPSIYPTERPSEVISMDDDDKPSFAPSCTPTSVTSTPSTVPTMQPSERWSMSPTSYAPSWTAMPSLLPTLETSHPTPSPSPFSNSIVNAQFVLILSSNAQLIDQNTLTAVTQAVADAVDLPSEQFTIINSTITSTNQIQSLNQYLRTNLQSASKIEDILPGLTFDDDTVAENIALMELQNRLDESLTSGNFTSLIRKYVESNGGNVDDAPDVISAMVKLVNNIDDEVLTVQPTMAPTTNIPLLNKINSNNDSVVFSSRTAIILTSTLGAAFLILAFAGLWKLVSFVATMQQRAMRESMTPQHESDFGFVICTHDEEQMIEGRNPQNDKDNSQDDYQIVTTV